MKLYIILLLLFCQVSFGQNVTLSHVDGSNHDMVVVFNKIDCRVFPAYILAQKKRMEQHPSRKQIDEIYRFFQTRSKFAKDPVEFTRILIDVQNKNAPQKITALMYVFKIGECNNKIGA